MEKTIEEKMLEEWQERLGLQDWAIALRYNCVQSELTDQNAVGETEWETTIKSALIRIISKEEHGDRILDFDFEKTLVHELLHLKFGIIDIDEDTYEANVAELARHQLIDDLARALVMAKRGETKRSLAKDCYVAKDMSISKEKE